MNVSLIHHHNRPNLLHYFLSDDGTITAQLPPDPADVLDVTDGIEKSVADNFS